jgi:hypothetical protein
MGRRFRPVKMIAMMIGENRVRIVYSGARKMIMSVRRRTAKRMRIFPRRVRRFQGDGWKAKGLTSIRTYQSLGH